MPDLLPGEVTTAESLRRMIGGVLDVASATSDQGSIGDSVTALSGLSVTVDVPAGRFIKVSACAQFTAASAPGAVGLRIYRDATQVQEATTMAESSASGQAQAAHAAVVLEGLSGSYTFEARAVRVSAGGGTITSRASAARPAQIVVEDVGPA